MEGVTTRYIPAVIPTRMGVCNLYLAIPSFLRVLPPRKLASPGIMMGPALGAPLQLGAASIFVATCS